MVKRIISPSGILLLLLALSSPALLYSQSTSQLNFEELEPVPESGLTGMYLGVSNGALICMGGVQPSGSMSDAIYVRPPGETAWQVPAKKLPAPAGYGASFSFRDRIIAVGGSDGKKHLRNVYTIVYEGGQIRIDTLPSLPVPLAHTTGAVVGNYLFVAGGNESPGSPATNSFLSLDLAESGSKWTALESWPGPDRVLAVGASMHDRFFLFGGKEEKEPLQSVNEDGVWLRDGYTFAPDFSGSSITGGKWTRLSQLPHPLADGPGPAVTFGLSHILYPARTNEGRVDILGYNVEADSWAIYESPSGVMSAGGASAVNMGNQWVLLDQGSAQLPRPVAISKETGFGVVNWITVVVYLAAMLWIGFVHDKKGAQTTDNFFTAGGRIPWWAAGLSIYGTQLSAISFMAIPALVFATDWSLAIGSVLILATVPIVVKYYVPFFRKLTVTSAYEYLEHRFSRGVRSLASISFILFQLGRMGIVLYLPAVSISSVTSINIYLLICIMGIICIIYTVMGGIEAVVWTDVAQVIVLMGGAILCLIVAITEIDGGLTTVISYGIDQGKFDLFHLGWSADSPVLWVCIVGFFFLNIIPYTSDQTVVQRYLTVKNEAEVAKSLWTNAWITLPGTVVFFGVGTVMYFFYRQNPGIISSEKVDEILPYFVVHQLPAGIAGLVIAGIFAASQSTLSSSMNSISASFVSDLYHGAFREVTDRTRLRVARAVTIAAGAFGTGSAMSIAFLDLKLIFDLFQEILGILGGSLAGVFILGIFSKKANTPGVIVGLFAGVISVWLVRNHTDISVYLYGAISVVTCSITGYVVSLIIPAGKKSPAQQSRSDVTSS